MWFVIPDVALNEFPPLQARNNLFMSPSMKLNTVYLRVIEKETKDSMLVAVLWPLISVKVLRDKMLDTHAHRQHI